MCIYIYIEREREGERDIHCYTPICVHTYLHTKYITTHVHTSK